MWKWLKSWFVKSDVFEICVYIKDGINPDTGLTEPLVFIRTTIPDNMNDRVAIKSLTDLLFAIEIGHFHSGFIKSINQCRNNLGDKVNDAVLEVTKQLSNNEQLNNDDNIVIYPTEVFNRK